MLLPRSMHAPTANGAGGGCRAVCMRCVRTEGRTQEGCVGERERLRTGIGTPACPRRGAAAAALLPVPAHSAVLHPGVPRMRSAVRQSQHCSLAPFPSGSGAAPLCASPAGLSEEAPVLPQCVRSPPCPPQCCAVAVPGRSERGVAALPGPSGHGGGERRVGTAHARPPAALPPRQPGQRAPPPRVRHPRTCTPRPWHGRARWQCQVQPAAAAWALPAPQGRPRGWCLPARLPPFSALEPCRGGRNGSRGSRALHIPGEAAASGRWSSAHRCERSTYTYIYVCARHVIVHGVRCRGHRWVGGGQLCAAAPVDVAARVHRCSASPEPGQRGLVPAPARCWRPVVPSC